MDIQNLPEKTGVYIFKRNNTPIYIGKAKNIKERVYQHINNASKDEKERSIVTEADAIDWIITRNEFEALTLEIDLIQLHKPKYNVLHKYGGGYPLILITQDTFPTIRVVRGNEYEGEVFGPFFSTSKARKVKRLIHRLFKLRTCDPMPIRDLPCMDYHLGLCSAPCAGYVSKQDYQLSVESAKSMLSGQVDKVLPKLYEKLESYMSEMNFEKCAYIRDQILALENLAKGQAVSNLEVKNADVFYLYGKLLGVFLIRSSKLVDKKVFNVYGNEEAQEFIIGFYYSNPTPQLLLTNMCIEESIKEWLHKKGLKEISQEIKPDLVKVLEENLGFIYDEEGLREEFNKLLGIGLPERIEGFDISHFYGSYTVGACVVWERGFMNKKLYRRYRVKTVGNIDDYLSLEEVLTRRAKRLKSGEEKTPDIWLIDGGLGQLSIAVKVRDKFKLPIKVFALAKREETLITEWGETLNLKKHHKLYKVFGLIRDEAHRFALSYNRKLRLKESLRDVLENIKGIGPVKKGIIYRNFSNLYEVMKADDKELKRLGIDPSIKQEIEKYIC